MLVCWQTRANNRKVKHLEWTKNTAVLAAVLAIASEPVSALAAPVLPETEAQVKQELPKETASVENTDQGTKEKETDQRKAVQFAVKAIRVDPGETGLDAAVLEKLTSSAVRPDATLADLDAAAAAVTAYCRGHGWPAAAAYLPEQTAAQGQFTMKLLPGRYGEIRIDNQSRLQEDTAAALSRRLRSGELIRTRSLGTVLYTISGLGGIETAGILSPGKEQGTSDLTIRVRDGRQSTIILYSENYGSVSSGRYRYGLQGTFANLDRRGSHLSVSGLMSNRDLHNYSLSYDLLVDGRGTRAGLSLSRMNYDLGGIFQGLGARGKADTVSLFGTTPFWKTTNDSLTLSYGFDYRRLRDDLDRFSYSARKHSYAFHMGLNGFGRAGTSSLDYSFTLYRGMLVMDSEYARALDGYSRTSGAYTKAVLDLNAFHTFDTRWDIVVKGQWQKASRNLDSSEEIFLGGANAVRAYPQGEASGDEGWVGTAELRYRTGLPGLTLSAYLDGGHVKISRDGSSGGETLRGWGIGVAYSRPGSWFARLDYARRIGGDPKMSSDAEAGNRMWFMVGKVW